MKGGVRDIRMVVRRMLEWMRRKGDAFAGGGGVEGDR